MCSLPESDNMGDKKMIPELIDKRLQERLLDRGDLTAATLEVYLNELPDLADQVDNLDDDEEPSVDKADGDEA
jgi:hypothetical protein